VCSSIAGSRKFGGLVDHTKRQLTLRSIYFKNEIVEIVLFSVHDIGVNYFVRTQKLVLKSYHLQKNEICMC
jgi:hypothetical protein